MNVTLKRKPTQTSQLSCLFVGDPNLGDKGFQILKRHFPRAQAVIWKKGDKEGRVAARQFIRSKRWDLAFSFYNDLLLKPEDLAAIELPLNIHPARPELPGVGYDTIPLIEGHDLHGATLHTMNEKIDDGSIFEVLEKPLPRDATGKELRASNQELCLRLLESAAKRLVEARSWSEAESILHQTGNATDRAWSHNYVSKKDVKAKLAELETHAPKHPVFF